MNLQNKKRDLVFISWSGEWGRELAEFLRKRMFNFPPLEGWVSSLDIPKGSDWYNTTMSALQIAKFGVVCLTPGASQSSWLNFETGLLVGRLNHIKIIRFGGRLIQPLDRYQAIEGTNREDWITLLEDMAELKTKTKEEQDLCRMFVNSRFPELEQKRNELNRPPYIYFRNMGNTLGELHETVDKLNTKNKYVQENICFQKIILDSYQELYEHSRTIESSYSLPASQYPQYLISLQKLEPKPHVKAIALINVEERFWQQTMGKEILRTSRQESVRVFVFISEKDFETTYPTLLEHAPKYKVYAMSLARLSEVLGSAYTKDFSIINASGSKLLAVYDDGLPEQKNIRFIAETRTIDEYEKQFDSLIKSNVAVSIPYNAGNEIADIEQFMNSIFRGLASYETKFIEMSGYINVSDYDKHEEKHAYYQQMMQRMLNICLAHRRNCNHPKPSFEVLELGAGTGIFTRRLSTELPNVTKIDAIEIDWHCYHILKDKLRRQANSNQIEINTYHKDSRTYDPPGKFDYIFSSFADHHIKRGDKEKYFENVKRNLKSGGLLIVGDEFIPEHELNDRNARDNALRAYHNHIIKIAEDDGEVILAKLERDALQSGLDEKGDFKISCRQYEKYLREAGFDFNPPEKIGPPDRDDIGGVYVYTAWLRS